MTAIRLDGKHSARRYSIIGRETAEGVYHVGLLMDDGELGAGESVGVYHIHPPYHVDPTSRGEMSAHLVGWPDLSELQIIDIAVWLEKLRTWRAELMEGDGEAFQFKVHPPFEEERAEGTERVVKRKFSCAGFVVWCYLEGARLPLMKAVDFQWDDDDVPSVHFDESHLPALKIDDIQEIWGQPTGDGAFGAIPTVYGLDTPPPWRLLLPGYLLHACLPEVKVHYCPKEGEWRFNPPAMG